MGFWSWIRGDKHGVWADREIDRIRTRCGYTPDDPQTEAVGAALKRRIPAVYKQGGRDNYKYALALWQISNALYPEYITEEDYPKLTPNLWDDPVCDS